MFSECDLGWTYSPHTRYCYRRFDNKMLVFEAGKECERYNNGHLASIHDWYTNNFLVSLTSHLPASEANSWIGLYWNRYDEVLGGKWDWLDQSPFENIQNIGNPDGPKEYVEFNR